MLTGTSPTLKSNLCPTKVVKTYLKDLFRKKMMSQRKWVQYKEASGQEASNFNAINQL